MISILVAAYNAEPFICEMVESVLSQSYKDWELVIVDDGSTDQTYNLCNAFQISDPRVRVLQTENNGAIAARNHALKKSFGEYIVILDADDVIYKNKLEIQHKILSESDFDVVYGDVDRCDSSLKVLHQDSTVVNKRRIDGDVFQNILCGNLFSVHAAMFKRQALREEFLHPPSVPIIADWELWSRLSQSSKFIAHPDRVGAYRMHELMSAKVDDSVFQLLQRENTLNCFKTYPRFAKLGRYQKSQIILAHGRFAHGMRLYRAAIRSYIEGINIYPFNFKIYIAMVLSVAGFFIRAK